jgi:hypothetical protein
MKLRCIDDHEVVTVKNGFLQSKEIELKINGITVDKVYIGQMVAIVDNTTWTPDTTKINEVDYKFMIFDDNHKWSVYDMDLFVPEE